MEKIVTYGEIQVGDVIRMRLDSQEIRLSRVLKHEQWVIFEQTLPSGFKEAWQMPAHQKVLLVRRPFPNEDAETAAVLAISEAIRVYEFGLVGGSQGRHDIREALDRYELGKTEGA